jgi:hypothetical protein
MVTGTSFNVCFLQRKKCRRYIYFLYTNQTADHYTLGAKGTFNTVLRIHEILVRIRIRGSIPLTNGSGSCYFRQ